MNIRFLSIWILCIGSLFFSGCAQNKELEKDASGIADAMCQSIEIMNKLKTANPQDTILIDDLHLRYQDLQQEMETLYSAFREKYKSRMNDSLFNQEFSNALRKAILDCQYLSAEDRERFEQEMK